MRIPDDPIISCIERTGYPPWFFDENGKLLGEGEEEVVKRKVCKRLVGKFNPAARADAERYRRYAEAKRKIPMDLSAEDYAERVKALARKYHI